MQQIFREMLGSWTVCGSVSLCSFEVNEVKMSHFQMNLNVQWKESFCLLTWNHFIESFHIYSPWWHQCRHVGAFTQINIQIISFHNKSKKKKNPHRRWTKSKSLKLSSLQTQRSRWRPHLAWPRLAASLSVTLWPLQSDRRLHRPWMYFMFHFVAPDLSCGLWHLQTDYLYIVLLHRILWWINVEMFLCFTSWPRLWHHWR